MCLLGLQAHWEVGVQAACYLMHVLGTCLLHANNTGPLRVNAYMLPSSEQEVPSLLELPWGSEGTQHSPVDIAAETVLPLKGTTKTGWSLARWMGRSLRLLGPLGPHQC